MTIGSPLFILYIIIALYFWWGVPSLKVGVRLLLLNVVFLASFYPDWVAVLPIAVFAGVGYVGLAVIAHFRRTWVLFFVLAALVGLFVIIKRYSVVVGVVELPIIYVTVGMSYVLFRVLQLAIDLHQEAIQRRLTALEYLNFLFFFLTFVSGPIQSYQDHRATISNVTAPDGDEIKNALARVVLGLVKVTVVATVAYQVMVWIPLDLTPNRPVALGVFSAFPTPLQTLFEAQETGEPLIRMAVRMLVKSTAFLIYLYYNFAGYMDIVVGIGVLFGLKVPENFQYPFAANNFLDFWSRWHITLSEWFKTYLFNPMLRVLLSSGVRGYVAAYLAVPAFFITFMVMGIWHGTTGVFVIYGVLLGGGISANKLYQLFATGILGRDRYRSLAAHGAYKLICRGTMVSYFSLSLGCLWLSQLELFGLFTFFGFAGLLKLWLVLSVLTIIAFGLWDSVAAFTAHKAAGLMAVAYYLGFFYLAMIWGSVGNIKFILTSTLGLALPGPILAIAGAVMLVFAWSVSTKLTSNNRSQSNYFLVGKVMTLFIVNLIHTGSVPDFIYKGF